MDLKLCEACWGMGYMEWSGLEWKGWADGRMWIGEQE